MVDATDAVVDLVCRDIGRVGIDDDIIPHIGSDHSAHAPSIRSIPPHDKAVQLATAYAVLVVQSLSR